MCTADTAQTACETAPSTSASSAAAPTVAPAAGSLATLAPALIPTVVPSAAALDTGGSADASPASAQRGWWLPRGDGSGVIAVSSPEAVLQASGVDARTLSVPFGQTATIAIEGATAAYSLDAGVATAAASSGVVTVVGRNTGTTHVVVTHGAALTYVRVFVGDPPVTRLAGFTAAGQPDGSEGTADLQYASNPGMLQAGIRLLRREGAKSIELAVRTASALSNRGLPPVSLPLASLTFKNARRQVTLMDAVVENSPLTLAHSNVRGLHWQEGPLRLLGGYNFFGSFEHLLLPSERYAVAGVSYRQRLGQATTLTPNLYYYRSSSRGAGDGLAATAALETTLFEGGRALAEVAVGGGTAGLALDVQVSRPELEGWATVRLAPDALPSMRTDQPAGQQIDAGLTRQTERWRVDSRVLSQRFPQARGAQSSHVARVDVTRTIDRTVQVRAGSFVSKFDAGTGSLANVTSVGVPAGVAVNAGPLGAGVDYQWSRDSGQDKAGHLLRASASATRGRLQVSGSVERQTQAPTLAAVYAEQPALQRELDRLGIAASTPEQLAEVLRTNASLANLGYSSLVRVDRAPTRDRVTGRVSWVGQGRLQPRIDLATTTNRDALATRTSRTSLHSATASALVTPGTEAALTWSLVCPDRPTTAGRCQPAVVMQMRQRVGRAARVLGGPAAGDISGVVFRDEEALGRYVSALPPLSGYEVVLDGARRSLTGPDGRYRFSGVTTGAHRVEVVLPPEANVHFTTPSPVQVHPGESAHFGIATTRSRLHVKTLSDVRSPLQGVVIHATDGTRTYTATTDADGVAPFEGMEGGTYDVYVDAGSLPVGYYVADPAPRRAAIMPTSVSALLDFVVSVARSIAGRVRAFNRDTGAYVPAGDTVVALQPMLLDPETLPLVTLRSTTDAEGRYVFRGLAAGTYTVSAGEGGGEATTSVTLPVGPATLTDVDLRLPAAATAVTEASSKGDR